MTAEDSKRRGSTDGLVTAAEARPAPTAEQIRHWLLSYVAQLLESDEASIAADIPFQRFGMDSSAAVGMAGDLEEWLGFEVQPTLPYDYPTIDALAHQLA